MTDKMLANFKQHGIRITYKNKYMQYDDNDTWVVMGKRIHEKPFVLYSGTVFDYAFNVLLHG